MRYNQITGNSGYGILRESGSGTGIVKAVANNIYNNRIGAQAECNNKGEVNHNFWGAGVDPAYAISRCIYTAGKRLGAAITTETSMPGVNAQSVTSNWRYRPVLPWAISLEGTSGVKLIVSNHGNGKLQNIPFLGIGTDNITACSNFYDVFVADDNQTTPNLLNVYIRYDSACESLIETTTDHYCISPYSKDIPLLWYDPQYLGNRQMEYDRTRSRRKRCQRHVRANHNLRYWAPMKLK